MTDDECLEDADLALARASTYQEQGSPTAANGLLRRALEAAVRGHDAESSRRMTEALSRQVGGNGVARTSSGDNRAAVGLSRPALSWRAWLGRGLLVALLVVAALLGRREPQMAFALLLLGAVVLWVGNPGSEFVVGLGLLAACMVFGIAKPGVVLSGFGSTGWLLVVAILGITHAAARSGLSYRTSLLLIRHMPRALLGQAGMLLLTGVIMTPFLPTAQARVTLISPLALAVAQARRLRDGEPGAAVLGLAAWIGAGPLMFLFINGSATALMAWGLLPAADQTRFDYLHWFLAALPLGVIISLGSLGALFVMLRPSSSSVLPSDRVDLQLAVLGPPSRRELTMLIVLALTVVGWAAAAPLHIDMVAVALVALVATVLAGNFDRRSLRDLDWNYLIYLGVAESISGILAAVKLDQVIARSIGAVVTHVQVTPVILILAAAVISLFVQSVLPKNQGVLLIMLALTPIVRALAVNPWVVAITALAMSSMWFILSQTPSYLIAYATSEGRLFSHAQARRVCVAYTAITVAGLMLSVPYWHWMGLL